jgi:hypothetical protein
MLAKHALYQLSYGPVLKALVADPALPKGVVGPGRLELPTLRLSGVRSNHLSYGPMAARATPQDLDQPGLSRVRDQTAQPRRRVPMDRPAGDGRKEKRRRRRPAPV